MYTQPANNSTEKLIQRLIGRSHFAEDSWLLYRSWLIEREFDWCKNRNCEGQSFWLTKCLKYPIIICRSKNIAKLLKLWFHWSPIMWFDKFIFDDSDRTSVWHCVSVRTSLLNGRIMVKNNEELWQFSKINHSELTDNQQSLMFSHVGHPRSFTSY